MYPVSQLTCIDLIKRKEGLYLKRYLCPTGIPTIGYGNTAYPRTNPEIKEITAAFAEELLRMDLQETCNQLNQQFAKDKVTLNINQYSACVSFAFNIGVYAFTSSRAYKICIKLNPEDFKALEPRWLQWSHVGKTQLKGLLLRRQEEFALYCTPVPENKPAQEVAVQANKAVSLNEPSFFDFIKTKIASIFRGKN